VLVDWAAKSGNRAEGAEGGADEKTKPNNVTVDYDQ